MSSAADLSGPYWTLEKAQSVNSAPSSGEYNYTKAQFVRDLQALVRSGDWNQFSANARRLDTSFSRQTLKRVMEYIVKKIDSRELEITVNNELKCLHVRTLAKSGLVRDLVQENVWEGSGRFRSQVLTGQIATLDIRWACDQLVKFKVLDAAASVSRITPQVVKDVVQTSATVVAANTPSTIKSPIKAASNWVAAHPAKAGTAVVATTAVVGLLAAPVTASLALTGLIGFTAYRILG